MIASGIPRAVGTVLRQATGLLRTLDDSTYTSRISAVYHASIGGHVRHCLDHFQSILDGIEGGEINYDQRGRDPRIESDRDLAWRESRRILQACDIVLPSLLDRGVLVKGKPGYGDTDAVVVSSTYGREAVYAIAHAIHHYALIGVICNLMGVALPPNFGVAPSTICHRVARTKVGASN
jgi:hypothetical protein